MRVMMRVVTVGFLGGVLATYLAGPAVGRALQRTGARLTSMDGDVGFVSATEAAEFIAAQAKVAVAEEARRFLPPARVFK